MTVKAASLASPSASDTSTVTVQAPVTATTRVSVDGTGTQATSYSGRPTISTDGRYVAFASVASSLVSGDTNSDRDIFVHDRQAGQLVKASLANDGSQGNGASAFSEISRDGRFVAFESPAYNLVSGDTNKNTDIFVRQLR